MNNLIICKRSCISIVRLYCHYSGSCSVASAIYLTVSLSLGFSSTFSYLLAMVLQTRPEPMNASPHHSKVKVSLALGHSIFVAGEHVTGKMEVECRADKGLGIGIIMVELFGIEGACNSYLRQLLDLRTFFSFRAHFARSLCNLHFHAHSPIISRSRLTSFECRPTPSRHRRSATP